MSEDSATDLNLKPISAADQRDRFFLFSICPIFASESEYLVFSQSKLSPLTFAIFFDNA